MDNIMIDNLFMKVLELSKKRKINWESTQGTSFKAQLKNFVIFIMHSSGMFTFIIMNDNGNEIGRISNYESNILRDELDKMYDLAKRKALKIDESLNEINSILDSL